MTHTFTVTDKEHTTSNKEDLNGHKEEPWFMHEPYASMLGSDEYKVTPAKTIGGASPLFHAASLAFNYHAPLVWRPDDVWLTLLSGLAYHINNNTEELTHLFGEKKTLHVMSGGRLEGLTFKNWEGIFEQFASQIEGFLGDMVSWVPCNFSTSNSTDLAVSQIMLMGALKEFFGYRLILGCGLTQVTLEGNLEDWVLVKEKAQNLRIFGLDWWVDILNPVLDHLIETSKGDPDIEFWEAIYLKHRKGSGSQYDVSGWINAFYPYKKTHEKYELNPFCDWEKNGFAGLDPDDFPLTYVSCPLEINDNGDPYEGVLRGGLVGVVREEDSTVRPVSGWSIGYSPI